MAKPNPTADKLLSCFSAALVAAIFLPAFGFSLRGKTKSDSRQAAVSLFSRPRGGFFVFKGVGGYSLRGGVCYTDRTMNKKIFIGLISGLLAGSFFFTGCNGEEDSPLTGVKISASASMAEPGKTVEITASYVKEDKIDTSADITLSLSSDTTGGAYFGSAGTTSTSIKSGGKASLTLGETYSAILLVTAACKESTARVTVGTILDSKISAADRPTGFASYKAAENFGGYKGSLAGTTVTTRSDLINAVKKGGIIYVKGMIDMTNEVTNEESGSKLPAAGGYSTDSTPAMDAWVKEKSGGAYTSYSAWVSAYSAACSTSTDDRSGKSPQSSLYGMMTKLNSAWKSVIQLTLVSNTTLIGIPDEKGIAGGIRGATLSVRAISNVAIRNLVIQDACDPFTHHEANDGFNAQFDNISIDAASNIWIDHCTLQDTLHLGSSGEKWQVYDGLCDIKGSATNITVSYCKFMNHDKTMLIGSSDNDGDSSKRFVTLHHNYYYGCSQRLPMVRNTSIHIFNNLYESTSWYSNSYAIGRRANSLIIAENNYFGSGITAFSNSEGSLYSNGNNTDNLSGSKPFNTDKYYIYVLQTYEEAKSDLTAESGGSAAGAGKVTVITN